MIGGWIWGGGINTSRMNGDKGRKAGSEIVWRKNGFLDRKLVCKMRDTRLSAVVFFLAAICFRTVGRYGGFRC